MGANATGKEGRGPCNSVESSFLCPAPYGPGPAVEPECAAGEHQDPAEDAQRGGGEGRGLEIGHGDQVLDLHRSRQAGHGEGKGPQGDGGGDQSLGDFRFAKQGGGQRVDRKYDHKQRNAAVRQQGTREDNGQDGVSLTQGGGDLVGDHLGRAGVLHQLAENGAQQEDGEKIDDELSQTRHEDLGVRGEDGRAAADHHRQQRQGGGQDDDVDAPIGQAHQQAQRQQYPENFDHRSVISVLRRSLVPPARPAAALRA